MPVASLRKFEPRKRVIYARNPLVEVVCVAQFPALLELRQNAPAAFQRRIAKDYPFVDVNEVQQIVVGRAGGEKIEQPPPESTYVFSSPDRNWKVTLEGTRLGLTCLSYKEWPEFRRRFESALAVAQEIYEISLYSRFGLRYRDVIDREKFGLQEYRWVELVDQRVFGTFFFFSDDLDHDGGFNASIELAIPPGMVRVQVGKVVNRETKRVGLIFDTDCFVERDMQLSVPELMAIADDLHAYTGTVFHACITDKLHAALQD